MDSITLCDPYALISYIEFVGRIYGTENESESYPLYFANPNLFDASFPINSEETLNFDIEKSQLDETMVERKDEGCLGEDTHPAETPKTKTRQMKKKSKY